MTARFERADEATSVAAASARLAALCVSVQGEMVRANARLQSEYFREGMENYYGEEGAALEDTHYGAMLCLLLDTLVANRGAALDADDVAYFANVRSLVGADFVRGRLGLLENDEDEGVGADAAAVELAPSQEAAGFVEREALFNRAEHCIANYCLANPALVDRDGKPAAEENGIRDLARVIDPTLPEPPPPPRCPRCGGKGWIAPTSPSDFPKPCGCKTSAA